MDGVLKGSLFTAAAAVMWGGAPIAEKEAMNYVNPVVLGAWRYFLAGLMVFLYLKAKRVDMDVSGSAGRKLFFASFLGSAFMPALFYTGLFLTDPITAAAISNTGVIWAGLFGIIFLKERIKGDELVGSLLVFAGIYLMAGKASFSASAGVLMLIAASILGAAAAVAERKTLSTVNPWVVSLYDRLAGGSVSLIVSLFLVGSGAVLLNSQAWSYLFLLSIFGSLIPALFFFHGLRLIEAERSAAILATSPLFTILFTSLFTNAPVSQNQFAAALMIIGGVVILSASRKILWMMRHYSAVLAGHEAAGVKKLRRIFGEFV
ncbi:MAG: DMT family transporter [Candidatus Aenigmarchaeota archaeon]|nr:DMT family transporter [Candidatus Aenigmarchaeota archaeon]